jgi:uncharacterized protein (DUF2252 family)
MTPSSTAAEKSRSCGSRGRSGHTFKARVRSEDDAPIEVENAAYSMKGCSSLGLLRFAVLLGIGERKKRTLALMDVKEAVAAAAPRLRRRKDAEGPGGTCICRRISADGW